MNNEQLQNFFDSYGADPARWPATQRAAIEDRLARDADARALLEGARRLDALLSRTVTRPGDDEMTAARVLTRLTTLPRQKRPLWRWPAVLLDWQFAPAWPRMAALACCAVVGFMVGFTGLDRAPQRYDAIQTIAAPGDIGLVFEPEALTGARP